MEKVYAKSYLTYVVMHIVFGSVKQGRKQSHMLLLVTLGMVEPRGSVLE